MIRLAACAFAAAGLVSTCAAAPAGAALPPNSLTLSPAKVSGDARPGTRVGPLGLTNGAREAYRVTVFPVLLDQTRDGALRIRDDRADIAAARRLLRVPRERFVLKPGASHSVVSVVRREGGRRGAAVGVMYRAAPVRQARGMGHVLQLTASVLLRPPGARARIDAQAVGAEQVSTGRLQLRTTVHNGGTAVAAVHGRVLVRDAEGAIAARVRLDRSSILPGATVDLAGDLRSKLAPGDYKLQATVRSAGTRRTVEGAMQLHGVNQVRTTNAKLVAVGAPEAHPGEPFKPSATFRNTGNVDFAPQVSYEARAMDAGPEGRVLARGRLGSRAVAPGRTGSVTGTIRLPDDLRHAKVTLILRDGERELDQRDVSVTVTAKPSMATRVSELVAGHAIAFVAILVSALAAALMVLTLVLVRQRQRRPA